ncbi:hypothetical protein D3C80_1313120 [compost metagenome]
MTFSLFTSWLEMYIALPCPLPLPVSISDKLKSCNICKSIVIRIFPASAISFVSLLVSKLSSFSNPTSEVKINTQANIADNKYSKKNLRLKINEWISTRTKKNNCAERLPEI